MSLPISVHPHLRSEKTVKVTSKDFPEQGEMLINLSDYEENKDLYELVKPAARGKADNQSDDQDPEDSGEDAEDTSSTDASTTGRRSNRRK